MTPKLNAETDRVLASLPRSERWTNDVEVAK